jgi:hypothetical protein
MVHPQKYNGSYTGYWAGYKFKEKLGYTTGVHTGVDYNYGSGNQDKGFTTMAICDGKVVAKISNGTVKGFGNALIIESLVPSGVKGTKMYHRYMHMDTITVSKGQTVKHGQKIGTVGNTGTTYAHTHLDVWTNRNGLGAHWEYHNNSRLESYEDPYKLIEKYKSWTGTPPPKPPTDPCKTYKDKIKTLEADKVRLTKANEELTKTVARLNATVKEQQEIINGQKIEINELTDENAKLRKQLEDCGTTPDPDSVVITKDGLWGWFTNLFKR